MAMESLQLSQVLADLSNLRAAEPEAAAAIIEANVPVVKTDLATTDAHTPSTSSTSAQKQRPTSALQRVLSSEGTPQPKFDKMGRRIRGNSPKSGSATSSIPGTPRHSDTEDDLERANTLMALYEIRAKLKQQDNSSLLKAREKINALAARQQAQQAAERNLKMSEEIRRNRYSFPKSGL